MASDAPLPADLGRQIGELLREQREIVARLQQGQGHFRELARSVWRVQEEERRRLAHDLHDGVGHNLTAVLHLLAEALAALPPRPALARERVQRARAIAETTLADTRALSRLLRPQVLDDLGLEAALRWLARTFGETHGLAVSLAFEPLADEPDNDLRTLVFRIAQEALVNAARHARATQVEVAFRVADGCACLDVADDGCGCDVEAALAGGRAGASGGLGGMRERARLYGGTLDFDSRPGAGFRLRLRVPLADDPRGAAP
jgi:signal transduction histidine kinase